MVMTTTQYISVRESAQLLGVPEEKIMELIEGHQLQAYRIADRFLRLKKSDIVQLRNSGEMADSSETFPYTSGEKLADFFYFNDFYILSSIIIFTLLYLVFFT